MTFLLDGRSLSAELGEPLAVALVAAGALSLARSPKFHRPRGPSCFRAACDGCLARVDDRPNVMTCRVRTVGGAEVVSQNALGSRTTDLLRMTDWFFPNGMNHHELFAGVPGLQSVMQAFARRVAGLGKLPTSVLAPKAARRAALDVCVVGAGPSGMATALAFTKKGRSVRVIDDGIEAGGVARSFGGERGPFGGLLADFRDAVARGHISLSLETTAGAFYERDLLVVGDVGAEILTAATMVLAAGAHDGQAAFEGNDVPGVMSMRAAATLLAHGVLVGDRIAWVADEEASPLGVAFVERARSHGAEVLEFTSLPSEALGNADVTGVAFSEAGERVLYDVDAVVLDLPPCPSHELAVQVGARVRHEPRGYVVVSDERGSIADGVLGVGEMVGTALSLHAILAEAERVSGP